MTFAKILPVLSTVGTDLQGRAKEMNLSLVRKVMLGPTIFALAAFIQSAKERREIHTGIMSFAQAGTKFTQGDMYK